MTDFILLENICVRSFVLEAFTLEKWEVMYVEVGNVSAQDTSENLMKYKNN